MATKPFSLKTWMAHVESLKLAVAKRERELEVANLTVRRRLEIQLYLARYRRQIKDSEERIKYLKGELVGEDKW